MPDEHEVPEGCRFHAPRSGHLHVGVDFFGVGISGSYLSVDSGGRGYLISAKYCGEAAGYDSSWLIEGESGQWYLQRNFHAPSNIANRLDYTNYTIKTLYPGSKIAIAASTGCSCSGPHFHIETYPVSDIDEVLEWLDQQDRASNYWSITELKETEWVGEELNIYRVM